MQFITVSLLLVSALFSSLASGAKDKRSEDKIISSPPLGGPHGDSFDDYALIGQNHKRISKFKISGACAYKNKICRVFSIGIQYRDNVGKKSALPWLTHGKERLAKESRQMSLDKDEYILVLEVGTFRHAVGKIWRTTTWTRIGWLRATTNKLRQIEYGTHEEEDKYSVLTEGALLYLSGRSGDMLDQLTAHWINADQF